MTMGQLLFYGGIGLAVLGIVMILLCIPLFAGQRKKLEKKIQEEYME